MRPVPFARSQEGLTLFKSFRSLKGETVSIFLDGEIGRDDFRAGLSKFDIVHFAGHVRFDEKDPAQSVLKLKDDSFSARDFALLEGSAAAPEFVFFDACQSARTGPIDAAGAFSAGAFGIADAAMRTGVRHFLSNLWEIDDKQSDYMQFSLKE